MTSAALAVALLGGAVTLPPPDGVMSSSDAPLVAPLCLRALPSGAVVEGPDVCVPSMPVPVIPMESQP